MGLFEKSAHELHALLEKKEITAKDLTEDVFSRVDAVEDKVKAYLMLTKDAALKAAGEADAKVARGETLGFLEGIPGAIKDNICTKGIRTTCASKILENFVPPYDATVVRKLHAAGRTVVVGKANLDEFAMGGSTENSAYQTTHNPWNLDCVPGGSAAAVAAGTAIWALGSDTGGSIRQPAAFCGVVGLKPTYGRVSRYGLVAYASSLDQIGPLTRDVTDAAHIMNIIAGNDPMDSTSSPSEVPDYTQALTPDEVEAAVRKAIDDFTAMGAEVVELSLPHTKYAISTYYLIAPAEAATNLERYDGVSYGERIDGEDLVQMMTNTRTELFGEEVKRRIVIGNNALSSGYFNAY